MFANQICSNFWGNLAWRYDIPKTTAQIKVTTDIKNETLIFLTDQLFFSILYV